MLKKIVNFLKSLFGKKGGALLLPFLFLSCSHTTVIRALDSKGQVDKDVSIYVEGSLKGQGEVEYSDKKIAYSMPYYEMKKESCLIIKENIRAKVNWPKALGSIALAGAGGGTLGWGIEANDLLYIGAGSALSLVGIVLSFFSWDYLDLHEREFQCARIDQGA